jgi:hypothetical protein
MPAKKTTTTSMIYQLKITIKDSKPPIWRRIQVKDDTTLYKLHQIIQIAMGWMNSHLHQFIAGGVYYGEPDPEYGFDMVNEKRSRLQEIVCHVKDKCLYEYDFGDGWEHEILLEKILEPEAKTRYPCCLTGKRQCPPEDIGGVWGYMTFLEAIGDPDHPEHDEYLEWVEDAFDPEVFDVAAVNRELKQIR